jgi:hypothetical protein
MLGTNANNCLPVFSAILAFAPARITISFFCRYSKIRFAHPEEANVYAHP